MAVTQPIVRFGIYDVTAKDEAVYSGGNMMPTNDYEILRLDLYDPPLYATAEHNQWLLNGDRDTALSASDARFPIYSSAIADEMGNIPAGTFLEAAFVNPHTSAGITVIGDTRTNTWANQITIEWLNAGGVIIESAEFEPDRAIYFAAKPVADYYGVVVRFERMNKPHVRVAVLGIRYGLEYIFASDEIQTAEVVQEMSPISEVVISGRFNFTALSRGSSYDIFNSVGNFEVVQAGQRVVVSEMIDGTIKPVGAYYLEEWDFSKGVVLSFKCVDKIGMLEKDDSVGGLFHEVSVLGVVGSLFSGMDVDIYVHPEVRDIPISGWFPIADYRAQLQYLAFAIGATVFVAPDGSIHIQPLSRTVKSFIEPTRKFIGQVVERRPVYTDIEVTAYSYVQEGSPAELLRETYKPGTYTVFFDSPTYNLVVYGATLVSANVNHVRFTVAAEGEVYIVGNIYTQKMETARASRVVPLPGGARTFLNAEGCTVLSSTTAAFIAQNTYNYYNLTQRLTFDAVLEEEVIGDLVQVTMSEYNQILGTIVGMRINLAGLVTQFTVVGELMDTREGDTMWRIPFYSNERAAT